MRSENRGKITRPYDLENNSDIARPSLITFSEINFV